ncbi:MAG: long-chain fatty acid--CoA ligase [Sphingobacteriales bacterium]|nr:long-chain fatty acid--CoA ligase [Sphingobacteriales bacterium]
MPRTLYLILKAKAIHGKNLCFLLKLASDRFAGKPAITDGNRYLNFRELYHAVLSLSSAIRSYCPITEKKASAVLACNNSFDHIIFLYALQNLGIKVILVNHKAHINEINSIRENQPEPCYLFSSEPDHLNLRNARHIDTIIASSGNRSKEKIFSKKYAPVVFPTSGTTGQSKLIEKKKGVFYWLYSFADLVTCAGIDKRDAVFISSPVSHSFGYSALLFALVLGKKAMITENKNHQEITDLIIKEKIDLLSGVPSSLYQVAVNMKGKTHPVRLIISGGAALTEAILQKVSQELTKNIFSLYGSTEASTSFIAGYDLLKKNIHALGRPLKGIHYRLEQLPEGGKELLIKSQLANTSSCAWLHSGDMVEEDDNHHLIWCGRKDSMIIKNGFNIHPAEIENAILRIDTIEDVLVTGEKNKIKGEIIIAYIKTKPTTLFDEQKIREGLKAFLPGIKIPDIIIHTAAFEFTGTGKKIKPIVISSNL